MARYIVHIGTGTVIDIDDDVYVLDSEDIEGDIDSEQEMIDAAIARGTNIRNVMFSHELMASAVTYAPAAIREEVAESLHPFSSEAKEWVSGASVEALQQVAAVCMNDERTWENFHVVIADAVDEVRDSGVI